MLPHPQNNIRSFRNQNRRTKKNGGFWPFTSKKVANSETGSPMEKEKDVNIYRSNQISFQPIPINYKSIGILHLTESAGINALRDIGTGFANIVGSKGFDNTVYDSLRKTAFDNIVKILQGGQKVFNLRFDFDTNAQGGTVFIHLYGDLCELSQSPQGS